MISAEIPTIFKCRLRNLRLDSRALDPMVRISIWADLWHKSIFSIFIAILNHASQSVRPSEFSFPLQCRQGWQAVDPYFSSRNRRNNNNRRP